MFLVFLQKKMCSSKTFPNSFDNGSFHAILVKIKGIYFDLNTIVDKKWFHSNENWQHDHIPFYRITHRFFFLHVKFRKRRLIIGDVYYQTHLMTSDNRPLFHNQ